MRPALSKLFYYYFLFIGFLNQANASFLHCPPEDFYCGALDTLLLADPCPETESDLQRTCSALRAVVLGKSCDTLHDAASIHSCSLIKRGYSETRTPCPGGETDCSFGQFVQKNYANAFGLLSELDAKMKKVEARVASIASVEVSSASRDQFRNKVLFLASKIFKFQNLSTEILRNIVRGVQERRSTIEWKTFSGFFKSVQLMISADTGNLFVRANHITRPDFGDARRRKLFQRERELYLKYAGDGVGEILQDQKNCATETSFCLKYYPIDFIDFVNEVKVENQTYLGPYSKEQILYRITKQLLQTLSRLHRDHLFHGDLKPENVVYDRDQGQAVFIDFGLAREGKTQTLIGFEGTKQYWPPLMFKLFENNRLYEFNQNLERLDMFGLGVILKVTSGGKKLLEKFFKGEGLLLLSAEDRYYKKQLLLSGRSRVANFSDLNSLYQLEYTEVPEKGTLERVFYELLRSGIEDVSLAEVLDAFDAVEKPAELPKFRTGDSI